MRRMWLTVLWLVATWIASWRRGRAAPEQVARLDYRQQTRGMRLGMTERLRDQWRPRWMRLRRDEDGESAR